ncbi:MAG TPA: hypothetical protein VMW19_22870 [Myxococcota bacterium]|nr:hypothetical protein [Myxococcota bacterium]
MRRLSARAPLALLPLLWGCNTINPPIVQSQVVKALPGLLAKVAVAPFLPDPTLRGPGSDPRGVSAADAADLVTRFVTEALTARGVAVVAPNDLVVAFEAQGIVLPRGDPAALAALAASQFGATSIIMGTVSRYQEREGGTRGALRPAGVAFSFTLSSAPDGTPAFRVRFDQTQTALSANLFTGLQYPGNGMRWLTAAELARWGADNAVAEIPGGME